MVGETHTWWADVLYTWAPVLLMIGFWVFFMRRFAGGRQAKYLERCHGFMNRQEQLLERIATALEQRNAGRQ